VPGPLERRTGGSIYNLHLAESFKQNGCVLDTVSVPDLPYLAGLAAGTVLSPWMLLKLLRLKPDMIIEDAWAHPPLILFNVVSRLRREPKLVMILHQVRWREVFTAWSARLAETIALSQARLIVTASQFIKGEVERMTGNRVPIVVARPGSDGTTEIAFQPLNDDDDRAVLRLLFAGTCTRRKGLDELIEAMALLKDLPLQLDLAGNTDRDPRFKRKLVRLIGLLGLSERVAFHGLVDSRTLARLYSSADIFVFPSHYEGYGIVLAEAMKAGLPVVAADNGPAAEILSNNENALIVPVRDSRALAAAIRKLAEDPALRKRFGARSRALAENLSTWRDTCDVVRGAVQRLVTDR
jgi:glycosyltransferase involved in cell wall biosynthesis